MRTIYGPYFYLFIRLLSAFFPFFCQKANKTRSSSPIIGCNFVKETQPNGTESQTN